jgi:hypothetical protein
MQTRMLWLLVVCLQLCAAGSVSAQTLGVFPVQGTNLNEGDNAAIGGLIASALAVQTSRPVLGPKELAASLAQTQSERDSATALGVDEYVHVEAIRLSSRIALQASLCNKYGSVLYQVKTTALSLDDMEVVAERLAASLLRRTELPNTRTIDNVMGKETRAPNRMFLEKIFGARVAFVLPVASHLESSPTLQVAFDARLEQTDYFVEAGVGFFVSNSIAERGSLSGMFAQLGASYYLTHTSVSPYLGAGFSPRVFADGYSGVGLTANAHAGLMFMRESSTRVYLELQIDQNLIKVKVNPTVSYDYTNMMTTTTTQRGIMPTEFSFAAGLGF